MLLLFSLLFVNGGLIVAGIVALIAQGALASETLQTFALLALHQQWGILIGLGAWKVVTDRKLLATRRREGSEMKRRIGSGLDTHD